MPATSANFDPAKYDTTDLIQFLSDESKCDVILTRSVKVNEFTYNDWVAKLCHRNDKDAYDRAVEFLTTFNWTPPFRKPKPSVRDHITNVVRPGRYVAYANSPREAVLKLRALYYGTMHEGI